jgi:tRNA (cmo5U34)-methyltransferase
MNWMMKMAKIDLNQVLKEKFSYGAEEYDQQRKHVIPCLDDLYEIASDLSILETETPNILDLGAGTGLLSSHIFRKYPKAHFTLLDISEEMLKVAKERFKDSSQFNYVVANYLEHDFGEKYDLIVSSLSIHHLNHHDKKFLYCKIYKYLNPLGTFLNIDQVLGPSDLNEEHYQKNWLEKIDRSQLSNEEREIIFDRMKLDNPALLDENISWLRDCGFKHVNVYYKYYNFCIFYGNK